MGRAIFKRDKGKGTSPIPIYLHHPATAGWDDHNGTFAGAKVWFSRFSPRGQFSESGPNSEPMIFRPKMGKISPPVKSWVSAQKTGGEKISVFLWELEDFVESRSGIRSCGLLFCWVLLEDPASFIPLNRNSHRISQNFGPKKWVWATAQSSTAFGG